MEDYLDKLLQPEVLFTLFVVFLFGRATASGKKKANSLSPPLMSQAQIDAALKRVTMSKWLEIDAELDARKKIRAIKLLREAAGLGLKDAKDAIDARMRQRDLRLH
jgi:ribosomal protein L7/L12